MASAIKKFFQKKKLDVKFKKAGGGHRLDEPRPQTGASRSREGQGSQSGARGGHDYQRSLSSEQARAAEAALARIQSQGSKAPDPSMAAKARMRREMEQERKKVEEAQRLAARYSEPTEVVKDGVPMATILFTCPDIGPVVLPRAEMEAHIEEFLLGQLAEEPEMASALMIHTLNKDKEKVKICVDTLCKYLDNIIANPEEEKFRKIRTSNKAFMERISPLRGTEEFLQAAGFLLKTLPFDDKEDNFYLMEEEIAQDAERLSNVKAVLQAAEPIKPKLDRALKIFFPTSKATNFTIPDEFYAISPDELKKEAQRKQEAVEQLGMLRTKAMREREERRELLKYRYTLVRVRLPDGNLLQGTFKATEKIPALKEFIRENLVNDWMPFHLFTQTGGKLDSDNKTLAEYGLTPAVVVNFQWDKTVQNEVAAQQGTTQQGAVLKPEMMAQIRQM
ncbi:UBX domain-containing protein 6-like [Mya arenaria]|uniref:UBX domain-containing protein 6-like n=1 Tax=Mya arenaria TaxID=6604 RepID=UPI0022E6875D|nr:UBX domain-containing protein 6-like [Mya arenaria]XP_052782197.1 UBX domain-containing protein 6-like [Mya arenaria]